MSTPTTDRGKCETPSSTELSFHGIFQSEEEAKDQANENVTALPSEGCDICLALIGDSGDPIFHPDCGRTFHRSCSLAWVENPDNTDKGSCPGCHKQQTQQAADPEQTTNVSNIIDSSDEDQILTFRFVEDCFIVCFDCVEQFESYLGPSRCARLFEPDACLIKVHGWYGTNSLLALEPEHVRNRPSLETVAAMGTVSWWRIISLVGGLPEVVYAIPMQPDGETVQEHDLMQNGLDSGRLRLRYRLSDLSPWGKVQLHK